MSLSSVKTCQLATNNRNYKKSTQPFPINGQTVKDDASFEVWIRAKQMGAFLQKWRVNKAEELVETNALS